MKRFLSPDKIIFWITISIIINFIYLFIFQKYYFPPDNHFYKYTGDSKGYVNSVENLIKTGEFSFQRTDDKDYFFRSVEPSKLNLVIFHSFRTPGFAIFYYPLRLIFNQESALTLFVFLQTVLLAIAIYLISRLAFKLYNSKWLFYFLFIALSLYPNIILVNNVILTDSLGISFLIFTIYSFFVAFQKDNRKTFLFTGILITITIMLRPFLAPLLLFLSLLILFKYKKYKLKTLLIYLIIFNLPFFIFDGIWTLRNYKLSGKFVPLTSSIEFENTNNSAISEQFKITKCIGGSLEWWDKKSPVYWFLTKEDKRSIKEVFPQILFQEKGDTVMLTDAKKYFLLSRDTINNYSIAMSCEIKSAQLIRKVRSDFLKFHPFRYYIISRWNTAKEFILKKPAKLLNFVRYPFNVLFTFAEILITYFTYIIGFIGLLYCIFKNKNNYFSFAIVFIPLFLVFLFPLYFQISENRYIYLAFPFLLLSGLHFLKDFQFKGGKINLILKGIIVLIILVLSLFVTYQNINW